MYPVLHEGPSDPNEDLNGVFQRLREMNLNLHGIVHPVWTNNSEEASGAFSVMEPIASDPGQGVDLYHVLALNSALCCGSDFHGQGFMSMYLQFSAWNGKYQILRIMVSRTGSFNWGRDMRGQVFISLSDLIFACSKWPVH